MPIVCRIEFLEVSTETFGKLDYTVMAHAFACHKDLGRLADESIYQHDFLNRLKVAGFDAQREVPVDVVFESFHKRYLLDFVIDRQGIYELKTVSALNNEHQGQLLNYLLLLDVPHGKLINFRPSSVESRFVNAPATRRQRRSFSVDHARWDNYPDFFELLVSILRDWGTGLELHLYRQAMVHLLGGAETVSELVPMKRNGLSLGNQRFDLIDDSTAFRLTAFSRPKSTYENQLQRLLSASPLHRIGWVNITVEEVTFVMVES